MRAVGKVFICSQCKLVVLMFIPVDLRTHAYHFYCDRYIGIVVILAAAIAAAGGKYICYSYTRIVMYYSIIHILKLT